MTGNVMWAGAVTFVLAGLVVACSGKNTSNTTTSTVTSGSCILNTDGSCTCGDFFGSRTFVDKCDEATQYTVDAGPQLVVCCAECGWPHDYQSYSFDPGGCTCSPPIPFDACVQKKGGDCVCSSDPTVSLGDTRVEACQPATTDVCCAVSYACACGAPARTGLNPSCPAEMATATKPQLVASCTKANTIPPACNSAQVEVTSCSDTSLAVVAAVPNDCSTPSTYVPTTSSSSASSSSSSSSSGASSGSSCSASWCDDGTGCYCSHEGPGGKCTCPGAP